MITSYRNTVTYNLAHGIRVPAFAAFERIALRKIRQLQVSASLDDLRVPPGNHLEALKGDRADNTASALLVSTAFASSGATASRTMSR